MGHGPSTEWGKDHSADYKTKLGIVLFILYSLVYAAFVVLNVIWPKTMDMLIGEQNLSVVYGLGLIVGAFVYRELTWKKIYDALKSAVVVTGYVMFTIAAAGVLRHILTISHVPDQLVCILGHISTNRNVILLVILIRLAFTSRRRLPRHIATSSGGKTSLHSKPTLRSK